MNTNKQVIFGGVFWKVAERFGAKGVSFIVSIILARLLDPSDYGAITILTVFVSFADIFVLEGFASALIQKKEADNKDFSTAFIFNLVLSVLLYAFMFFFAPWVADFYEMPVLKPVLRIMALRLPIGAINSIQQAYVSRKFDFKKFFWATITGTIISAFIGIGLAVLGLGVWALVAQMLTNTIIGTIMLWFMVKWRPELYFSFERLKALFGFGMGILGYNLVMNFYDQLRSLIIGKKYSSDDLAYYSKGGDIPNIFVANINTSLGDVLFSLLSRVQDDIQAIHDYSKKFVQMSTYILSPILVGLLVTAEPLIKLLYTEKWLGAVPYLQIFCLGMLLRPLNSVNIQILKARGLSKDLLKMDMYIRLFGIAVLLIAMNHGVIWIALSTIAVSVVGCIIYAVPVMKKVKLSMLSELRNWLYGLFPSMVMGICVFLCGQLIKTSYICVLILQIVIGIVVFLLVSILTRNKSFIMVKDYLFSVIKGKANKKK